MGRSSGAPQYEWKGPAWEGAKGVPGALAGGYQMPGDEGKQPWKQEI